MKELGKGNNFQDKKLKSIPSLQFLPTLVFYEEKKYKAGRLKINM